MLRIYIAPQIGSGTFDDPYRSILNDFIDVRNGDRFDEIDNPNTRHSICAVAASQNTHDKIYADRIKYPERIVYVSPLVSNDKEKKDALVTTWATVPESFRGAAGAGLLKQGLKETDIINDMTIKDVLRILILTSFAAQQQETPKKMGSFRFMEEYF